MSSIDEQQLQKEKDAAVVIQKYARGWIARKAHRSRILTEFDKIFRFTEQDGKINIGQLPKSILLYEVSKGFLYTWRPSSDLRRFALLCRFIKESLEDDRIEYNYVGVFFNKEHTRNWMHQMRIILGGCMQYIDLMTNDSAASTDEAYNLLVLFLCIMLSFTSIHTASAVLRPNSVFAITHPRLANCLKSGFSKISHNLTGYVTDNQIYFLFRNMLCGYIKWIVTKANGGKAVSRLSSVCLTSVMTLLYRPIKYSNSECDFQSKKAPFDHTTSQFIKCILSIPAVIHHLHSSSNMCLGIFRADNFLLMKRLITFIKKCRGQGITFVEIVMLKKSSCTDPDDAGLAYNNLLTILANLINLGYSFSGYFEAYPNDIIVFLDILSEIVMECEERVKKERYSSHSHWHPMFGWFSANSRDSDFQDSEKSVKYQLSMLWSPKKLISTMLYIVSKFEKNKIEASRVVGKEKTAKCSLIGPQNSSVVSSSKNTTSEPQSSHQSSAATFFKRKATHLLDRVSGNTHTENANNNQKSSARASRRRASSAGRGNNANTSTANDNDPNSSRGRSLLRSMWPFMNRSEEQLESRRISLDLNTSRCDLFAHLDDGSEPTLTSVMLRISNLCVLTVTLLFQLRFDILNGLCCQNEVLRYLWRYVYTGRFSSVADDRSRRSSEAFSATSGDNCVGIKRYDHLIRFVNALSFANAQPPQPSSTPSPIANYVMPAWLPLDSRVLLLFNEVMIHYLSIIDDIEMYEHQPAFHLSDYLHVSSFLNHFLYKTITNVPVNNRTHNATMKSNDRCNDAPLTNLIPFFNFEHQESGIQYDECSDEVIFVDRLLVNMHSLLKVLYMRDSRRRYASATHWIVRDIKTSNFLHDYQKNKKNYQMVIEKMAHVLPYTERVRLFRRRVSIEKSRIEHNRQQRHQMPMTLSVTSGNTTRVQRRRGASPASVVSGSSLALSTSSAGSCASVVSVVSTYLRPATRLVKIRRSRHVQDAYFFLNDCCGNELKELFRIKFVNAEGLDEAGVDQTGLFKEFMEELLTILYSEKTGLFRRTSEGYIYPSPSSPKVVFGIDHLDLIEFAGKMLAKAIYEGLVVEVRLATFFISQVLRHQQLLQPLPLPTQTYFPDSSGITSTMSSAPATQGPQTTNTTSQANSSNPISTAPPKSNLQKRRERERRQQAWLSSTLLFSYLDELPSLDEQLYRSLMYMKHLETDIQDLSLTFTALDTSSGSVVSHELVHAGEHENVTNKNKILYIHLLAMFTMNGQIKKEITAFSKGFHSIFMNDELSLFSIPEIQFLISGNEGPMDIQQLRQHTQYYGGFHDSHKVIIWLWDILANDFTEQERGLFLKFVTSSSKSPTLGFGVLNPQFSIRCVEVDEDNDNGDTVGSIVRNLLTIPRKGWGLISGSTSAADQRLPTSSTCFNLLKLPNYSRRTILREKLRYAITCNAGFELT